MTVERLTIPSAGVELAGLLHLPDAGRTTCVIAAHGLLSTKASEKYVLLAEELGRAGIALCRFDFRGCGESGGRMDETTVAGRIADLERVADALTGRPELDGRLGLMGSSLGGFVALWVAHRRPAIRATVTWATPATLKPLLERRRDLLAHGLGEPFIAELDRGRYLEAPRGVGRCLVVHGDRDELVPVGDAHLLGERAVEPKAIRIIGGGDHRLTDPTHRLEAARLSAAWFRQHLS